MEIFAVGSFFHFVYNCTRLLGLKLPIANLNVKPCKSVNNGVEHSDCSHAGDVYYTG
jgi:hypothetical protein